MCDSVFRLRINHWHFACICCQLIPFIVSIIIVMPCMLYEQCLYLCVSRLAWRIALLFATQISVYRPPSWIINSRWRHCRASTCGHVIVGGYCACLVVALSCLHDNVSVGVSRALCPACKAQHAVFMQVVFLRASAMLKHVLAIGWTSVRPSHAGIVSKRLNILSCFLYHAIAHSF